MYLHTNSLLDNRTFKVRSQELLEDWLGSYMYWSYISSTPVDTAFDIDVSKNSSFFPCNMSLELWHQTLGHASLSTLHHISFLKPLCTEEIAFRIKSCDFCHKAKQQRLLFISTSIQTTDIFEMIHIDI